MFFLIFQFLSINSLNLAYNDPNFPQILGNNFGNNYENILDDLKMIFLSKEFYWEFVRRSKMPWYILHKQNNISGI